MDVSNASQEREEDLRLYRQMVLIRRFEETVLDLLSGKEHEINGPVHPYVGQEAVATGICAALRREDKIMSTHRGHGHCIAKGGRVDRMMAELFGKVTGYCKGKGGSMHIADFDIGMLGANGIVAAGLPIATGAAVAESILESSNIVVCMFGDGAAAAGPIHETFNIAALSGLPMIFVCENNGWSVNTTPEVSLAARSVIDVGAAFGIPGRTVDGNDVIAVRDLAEWAVDRGRRGQGPSIIEAKTFRRLPHASRGPIPLDSRDQKILDRWVERDPILLYSASLLAKWDDIEASLRTADDSIEEEIQDALDFARSSPFPELSDAFEDVFA